MKIIILNKVYIMFNNIPAKKKHIVNYGDWVNTMNKERTKYALNFFPNQYEYLKELYG